jgi:hypothetical protein
VPKLRLTVYTYGKRKEGRGPGRHWTQRAREQSCTEAETVETHQERGESGLAKSNSHIILITLDTEI